MKNKDTEAENANKKINDFFNDDSDHTKMDVEPLLSNNNRLLVLENQDEEN